MSILGILVLLGLVFTVVIVTWSRRAETVQQPSCGRCGYQVKGLPTFTCPECGSDLREVGIVTPGTRRPFSPAAKAVLWTIALPIPALIISGIIASLVPMVHRQSRTYRLGSPSSGAYSQVSLITSGQGYKRPVKPDQIVLELELLPRPEGPTSIRMAIDPANWICEYAGAEQVSDKAFDAQAVLDWMATAGIDRQDANVQAEAAALQKLVLADGMGFNVPMTAAAAGTFRSSGTSTSSSARPLLWLVPVLIVFWLGVWVFGLWRILWRRQHSSSSAQDAGINPAA